MRYVSLTKSYCSINKRILGNIKNAHNCTRIYTNIGYRFPGLLKSEYYMYDTAKHGVIDH